MLENRRKLGKGGGPGPRPELSVWPEFVYELFIDAGMTRTMGFGFQRLKLADLTDLLRLHFVPEKDWLEVWEHVKLLDSQLAEHVSKGKEKNAGKEGTATDGIPEGGRRRQWGKGRRSGS